MIEERRDRLVSGASAKRASDVRDDQVVACAAELFLADGIEAVKMEDIARAAGVGVATLYRHFSTKARVAIEAATLIWSRFNEQIGDLVESDSFVALDGLGRLNALLERYCDVYCMHADFMAFLDAFDHMVLGSHVAPSELEAYTQQINSFYPIFEDAYLLGLDDGSIVRRVDFKTFYTATAHALMGVAQKVGRGAVIPSDDFSSGREELQCLVDMAMWSLVSETPVRRNA